MGNTKNKIGNYSMLEVIGDGEYGTVYKASRNREFYAIKKIKLKPYLS